MRFPLNQKSARSLARRRGLAALLLALLGCAGDDGPTEPEGTDPPVPAAISIAESDVTLTALGDTSTLAFSVTDASGVDITSQVNVSWTSADPAVASVNGDGRVSAEAVGTTRIHGQAGDADDSVNVTVSQVPAEILANPAELSGVVGQPLDSPVRIVLTDANGHAIPGEEIRFTTEAGSISPAVTVTDAEGGAEAMWTLDTLATVGEERHEAIAEVTANPEVQAVILARARASTAVALEKILGEGYQWIEGEEDGAEIVVRVVDQYGNGVAEQPVTFEPRNGGIAVPEDGTTDDAGNAAAEWFMGNWDQDPFVPEARPDTLDVSAGALDPVIFEGTVYPRSTAEVFTSFKRELSTHHMTTSTLHSCPDSNVVVVYPDEPAGTPGERARILAVAGEDCGAPRLWGYGDPGYPPEKQITYEIPFFGLKANTTWKVELTIRGAAFGQRVGNNKICPATGCFGPEAVIEFSPASVPPNDGNTTVVTLDGSGSYDPERSITGFQWTLPSGTVLVDDSSTSDPVIEVTFPSSDSDSYTVTLTVFVDDEGSVSSASSTITVPVG